MPTHWAEDGASEARQKAARCASLLPQAPCEWKGTPLAAGGEAEDGSLQTDVPVDCDVQPTLISVQ
jgi:hypothetical protein